MVKTLIDLEHYGCGAHEDAFAFIWTEMRILTLRSLILYRLTKKSFDFSMIPTKALLSLAL
jgi:hypothetical protein